jgi:hypothetical protein
MKPERITIGTTVIVQEHYRIAERRGMVGRVVDNYGRDGYTLVDILFSDRLRWLFLPEDLEEISPPPAAGAFADRRWVIGMSETKKKMTGVAVHHTRKLRPSSSKRLRPTRQFQGQ